MTVVYSGTKITFNDASEQVTAAENEIKTLTATVANSALTITLSATPLQFRSATLGSGVVTVSTMTASASLVVPTTALLGTTSGVESVLTVGAMLVSGVVELFVVNSSSILPAGLNEAETITTTILDTNSNALSVAYSTTARTAVPFRIVGQITSTQATAGTWITAPSRIQSSGGLIMPKRLLQNLSVTTAELATGTGVIPDDSSIPQITEGTQFMTLNITPTSATSILEISVRAFASGSISNDNGLALFRDAEANALSAVIFTGTANSVQVPTLFFTMIAGTTSEIIFRVRIGTESAATITFNGVALSPRYGSNTSSGVLSSGITIKEYAA